MSVIIHPNVPPKDTIPTLVAIQDELLAKAESVLGPRDKTKHILTPRFNGEERPRINCLNQNEAYISLSTTAAEHWNAAEAEISHEVVHLLNPISGCTNYLEEGIATAFSQYAATYYGIFNPPSGPYKDALNLVNNLSDNPLEAGKALRTDVGALSDVTIQDLTVRFPSIGENISKRLVEEFNL